MRSTDSRENTRGAWALCLSPLLEGLTRAELEEARERLTIGVRSYARGEIILHAGSRLSAFGYVLSGSVSVERLDPWGNRTILALFDAGQFFAEIYTLATSEPLPVDAVAGTDSRIALIRPDFLSGVPSTESWAAKLTTNLLYLSARKNLRLARRSFETAPRTIRGRLMAFLADESSSRGSLAFDLPFDRQQLADYLCVERTALSRELGRMKREGLIDFQKNHFRILECGARSMESG